VATTAVTTTTVMEALEALHHHGLHAEVTTTVATNKVVDTEGLPVVELLLGNDSKTMLLLHLQLVVSTAMVAIQAATQIPAADMVGNRAWALLRVLVAALAVLVLHQAWVLYFKTTVRMGLRAVLHLRLLQMICLHL
jgi:hypothetical protein